MKIYYFSYGANTLQRAMSQRCPAAKSLGKATLENYKLEFAYHADVTESEGDTVDGVLWEVTYDCIDALDIFEGYPEYYNRKTVSTNHGGHYVNAYIYQMSDRTRLLQTPSDSYFNVLKEGYTEHGIDITQLDMAIAAVPPHMF